MVYFANRAINWLYGHIALHGFAENAGGVFAFVYLLRAGISVPVVLSVVAALLIGRLVFRQMVVPFAVRFSVRAGLMLGTSFVALSYVVLAHVEEANMMLALYMVVAAFGEAFYWTCFHAAVASLGDSHARGAQTSAIQLVYALTNVAGPLAGGFMLAYLGPKAAFFTAAAVQAAAVLPLRQLPHIKTSKQSRLDARTARIAAAAYFCDGISAAGNAFVWSMALFIALGEQFQAYGAAQALAALLGAAMALALGRLIDAGHPKRSAAIGFAALAVAIMCKAGAYANPVLAVGALAVGAIAAPIYASAYNSRIYNLSKESGDTLRFHVSGEGGWDLGTAAGCLMGAALVHFGLGFFWAISLGLFGVAGVAVVFRQSYQNAEPSLRV